MMPYRIANLSPDQMQAIENLENQLHVTLVAYEPERATDESAADEDLSAAASVTQDLLDAYQDYGPRYT